MFKFILIAILVIIPNILFSRDAVKDFENYIPNSRAVSCVEKEGPGLEHISKRAFTYAGIRPQDIADWKKKIRWSAALPRLEIGYERRVVDAVAVDIDDSVSVTSSGVVVGPTASNWDKNYDRNNNVEVKLIWYLDELVFNRDSLSISSEARSLFSIRSQIISNLSALYGELKRLISIYYSKNYSLRSQEGPLKLKINSIIEEINAFTGGWFSEVYSWQDFECK